MNELQKLSEFQQLLADYHVSSQAKETLHNTRLVLLAAPTSSGRNTIIHQLLTSGEYYFVVSDTTRKPRINNGVKEQDSVEYWFRSEDAMLQDIKKGLFLEAAVIHNQQVSGISIRELEKAKDSNKVAITDIEIVGVDSVLAVKPDTTVFFVIPPSFDEWHDRLAQRGKMHDNELKRRMQSACEEFRHALENDHYTYVINDELASAVERIQQVVFSGYQEPNYQHAARQVVEQLLVDTEKFLTRL
jgi:guanylate kinase